MICWYEFGVPSWICALISPTGYLYMTSSPLELPSTWFFVARIVVGIDTESQTRWNDIKIHIFTKTQSRYPIPAKTIWQRCHG